MNTATLPAPTGTALDLRDARNDRLFRRVRAGTVVFVLLALASAALSMLWGGRDALASQGLSFFFSAEWNPVENRYGALVPIYGTIVTAVIAMGTSCTLVTTLVAVTRISPLARSEFRSFWLAAASSAAAWSCANAGWLIARASKDVDTNAYFLSIE